MAFSQFNGREDGQGMEEIIQLVVERVEEFVVTLLEFVRERPVVAAAIVAGVVGGLIGSRLARPKVRKVSLPGASQAGDLATSLLALVSRSQLGDVGKGAVRTAQKGSEKARSAPNPLKGLRSFENAADVARVGVQLLENPLIRGYLRSMLSSRVRKSFSK